MTAWPVVALSDVAVGKGQYGVGLSSRVLSPGDPRYIRITDIKDDGTLAPNKVGVEGDRAAWQNAMLDDGDLLFARSGATVGKTYLHVGAVEPAVYAGYLIRFKLKPELALPNYVFRYTQSPQYHAWVKGSQRAVAQPNINAQQYGGLPIPLPPLPEQRRIAAILDHADALRAKRREALAHLDELTQSIFIDMFGDTRNSVTTRFADVVNEFRYGTSVKSSSDGVPVLRIPNVVGGKLDLRELKNVSLGQAEFERLRLKDGDLLFVRTNGNPENVGRCAEYRPESIEDLGLPGSRCVYASYLIRVRVDDELVVPAFLSTFLNGPGRKQMAANAKTSAGQFNINIQGLGSIEVPVPDMGRQAEFVQRAKQIEHQKEACESALAGLDALFASLQSRAFRGEL
ncbi:restriction endonuclease subunit S [Rhodococcus marinonascens]|uniref:restriction endonuclease subunit S n=1 Tax=Rhodococcus marinonascens TaxID=38311 RepID=UPI000A054258|nr:restriction endonuclease subunit S [Rhodococcus marinonascens]